MNAIRLFDLNKNIKEIEKLDQSNDLYEFCPRCEANLTLQKGYDNSLPYWICKGCGEMLINPEVETETNISWICDGCGAMLNVQDGFNEDCEEWKCTECGTVNPIDVSELYLSEDEYQASLRDPYKGLSDEDVLALSVYQDEQFVGDREDIAVVKDSDSGVFYIKKLLTTYDKSVYEYLLEHPIEHMPRVREIYESDNCLIVIEEYVKGCTVAELLLDGPLSDKNAVYITSSICTILDVLHNLPTPIIHRDIKPSNIIVTEDDEVYLLDMNVAKWYEPDKKDDTRYLGTEHYAAPEQVGYGMSASTTKTDIYGLGVLMNVMLTGDIPKEKQASDEYWPIIERCISLDAEKRYTAKELKTELDKTIGNSDGTEVNG